MIKSYHEGRERYPRIYNAFNSIQEVADVINRSKRYVNNALNRGFTPREQKMLADYAGYTTDFLFKEGN